MAQPSIAQREPSMEEILASIRRIIEDSEGGKRPTETADLSFADNDAFAPQARSVVQPDIGAESAAPEIPGDSAKPHDSEARSTRADVQENVPPAAAANDAFKVPERHEDGVTAIADDMAKAFTIEPTALETPDKDKGIAELAAEPELELAHDPLVDHDMDWTLEASDFEASLATVVSGPNEHIVSHGAEPVNVDAMFDHAFEQHAETVAAPTTNTHSKPAEMSADGLSEAMPLVRGTIISDHAGRQVAAAFGELADAFAARSKKSIETLAEDLMRPMLQDWLDNNLPHLVERLVREEIERVARGS